MMARNAAKTGPAPTVIVALEQQFPESARIINDELARQILPFTARAIIWLIPRIVSLDSIVRWVEKRAPGMWSGFLCRKRFIDDKLAEAMGDQTEVMVNLGAGFDTRAYRLAALSDVPVWEVDQPHNIKAKRLRLRKVLEGIPVHVTLVEIDFDHEILGDVLTQHGYAGDMKTFFVWEAVTQYLPEPSIRATFDFLARAPSGSLLAFTYVRKDFIDGESRHGHDILYEKMVLKEKSWLFGLDPGEVADFLSTYGWKVLEHLGYEELAERYVISTRTELLTTSLERIVYAEKL
jgi:methyltransferase (TIGR00027 family)